MESFSVTLQPALAAKRDALLEILKRMESVAVALSGGVDSAVVAQAAFNALGNQAIAVTAHSPSVAEYDRADAAAIARQIGIRHLVLETEEFASPEYQANDGSRCFHCKTELYEKLTAKLPELRARHIVSGANLDDAGDFRPGLSAAAEHGVRHPLQEAGLTKAEVRELARHWKLPLWSKPASPCLSSRIAPGVAATPERTARIEAAERFLRGHGFAECRVRLHEGDLARVEVPSAGLSWFMDEQQRSAFNGLLRQLGFRYITLDLEGLRSGSLNDLLSLELKSRFQPTERTRHDTTASP